ncbi:uncharacterized protein LOC122687904 [Cervus elaphus]|uniref:uncharacterized protein LOC122687904 n=1 Tax=Cervus elaphus TaxID=9860 RepID=UPI001CC2A366|nr:uncharacterized protein LOC122687904 [Cervus elaphus]
MQRHSPLSTLCSRRCLIGDGCDSAAHGLTPSPRAGSASQEQRASPSPGASSMHTGHTCHYTQCRVFLVKRCFNYANASSEVPHYAKSPTYEPSSFELHGVNVLSHVQSRKRAEAPGVRCHVRAPSAGGCASVCFTAQDRIKGSGAHLCSKPRTSRSECKSSHDVADAGVLFKMHQECIFRCRGPCRAPARSWPQSLPTGEETHTGWELEGRD